MLNNINLKNVWLRYILGNTVTNSSPQKSIYLDINLDLMVCSDRLVRTIFGVISIQIMTITAFMV